MAVTATPAIFGQAFVGQHVVVIGAAHGIGHMIAAGFAARVGERWGKLDVLVNNAGIISIHPIMEMTTPDFLRVLNVNTYCPGIVSTDMWNYNDREWGKLLGDYRPGELIQKWTDDIPLGQAQRPEDVANTAMFLACDAASAITGQALNVDGGMFMN